MLSLQKKAERLRHYFLTDPRVRKICLETSGMNISSQWKILNNSFSDLFLGKIELDYFQCFLNFKTLYTVQQVTLVGCRPFAALGEELGHGQVLSLLWKHGDFDRSLTDNSYFNDFYSLWRKNANLASLANCSDGWSSNCESCLIVDSYHEGYIGKNRNPARKQENQKHELIYLIGRDKYLDSQGKFPKL